MKIANAIPAEMFSYEEVIKKVVIAAIMLHGLINFGTEVWKAPWHKAWLWTKINIPAQ